MTIDDEPVDEEAPERRKRVRTWLIVGIVAAILAGLLLASSVWVGRWSGSDEVPANALADAAAAPDPEAWCAAQSTYDAIRSELFRRAAQVRGSDEQAYTRLADFALLRMSGPVVRGIDDELESVTCSATASLDLPPGVRASGGQRSLSGDLDYMVQPAADGTGNVVRLGNADSIVIPLATLSRTAAPQSAPLLPPELGTEVPDEMPAEEPIDEQRQDQSQAITASPSFDCEDARTRSEVAICSDPGLAALDREMAAQFRSAMMQADRSQRRLLERTRGRFLSYRDRCGTNQCIAETYRSRMREIADIMAERWRG